VATARSNTLTVGLLSYSLLPTGLADLQLDETLGKLRACGARFAAFT
jgi:hypothetical protein